MTGHRVLAVVATCLVLAWPAGATAQVPQPGRARLSVTVADQTGGVIPGAQVTVTRLDGATQTSQAPVVTSSSGVATIDDLAPGRYRVQVAFPGFETVAVPELRLRAGDNRRTVTLPIKKVAEEVVVGRDRQSAALDPRGDAFSTVLTRAQIEALPDDPDEMEQMLKAMSPPGSTMRVDGFSGGKLPPKAQIRSIRLPRMDMLAAQNHGGLMGMHFIDITTQPGLGPLRASTDFTLRDDALNARNPFTPAKGDEGLHQYGASLSGSLVPGKGSFSLAAQSSRQWNAGNLLAVSPTGQVADSVRQPSELGNVNGTMTAAIGRDHTGRVSFQRNASTAGNLGVGGFNLPETAFSQTVSDNLLRFSENGPLGRRFFSESRLQIHWSSTTAQSAVESPTVRVLDAFTSGGAQRSGGTRALELEAATDLDYVRGRHSLRTGVLFEGGRYRSNDVTNYLGTFTFASMDDYLAGKPSTYTRRSGDPNVSFTNLQVGTYLQDDFRVFKSLLLSYGARYEAQTLIPDQRNLSPRVTVTWSPWKSGKTSLRAGYGSFADWFGTSVYKQTLLVDGFRQREINLRNPGYPDPDLSAGGAPPVNRYLIGAGAVLPESRTANVGIDQSLSPSFRLSATYTYRQGNRLQRGRNLNVPVNGARPDPAFANVVEVASDAASRQHSLNASATLLKTNWHRTILSANYSFTRSRTNTTGAFSLPASGDDLSAEWGPSAPRHRTAVIFNTQPVPGLTVSVNARAQSGTPYTITTGFDDNGDGLFNDRPAGIGRNSALTPAQWDLGLRLSYAFGFGQRPAAAGPGGGAGIIMGGPGGGMPPGALGGGADSKRFTIEVYVAAQNVTDHHNFIGYSGVMTSPFFGRPTNVLNPRKIEIGTRFGF